MNRAQMQDCLLKLMLVLVRDRGAMQGRIRNVGYLREYAELPDDLGAQTLSRMSEEELLALAERVGIRKRPVDAKSDIYLNDVGYVIHALANRPLVIMDGLSRAELEQVCRQVHIGIEEVDRLAADYWELRRSGEISASISNHEPLSPFQGHRALLQPLITYYLFRGSERGDSRFPADCMLDYSDPMNTNTWVIYEPDEAMDVLWDRLSFRLDEDDQDGWKLYVSVAGHDTSIEGSTDR